MFHENWPIYSIAIYDTKHIYDIINILSLCYMNCIINKIRINPVI